MEKQSIEIMTEEFDEVIHIYPKKITQFRHRDVYEIQHPSEGTWDIVREYSNGSCPSEQMYIKFLIRKERVRILRYE